MNIYFTWEDKGNKNRIKYLRGALWRNGHRIIKRPPERLEENDAWMIGLSHRAAGPVARKTLDVAERAKGAVFFYQTNDENDFQVDRISSRTVMDKALFLRNHWPSDPEKIPAAIRGRTGFINPLIKPLGSRPGAPLAQRSVPVLFYGVNTGDPDRGPTCREKALRIIRGAGLPLRGGLVAHPEYSTPADLVTERVPPSRHNRMLSDTRICLALWGNCPLTYRLYEGLSRRCLVVTPSLAAIRFVNGGLAPGRHYVEVKPDLSDLAEILDHYLRHLDEAQHIADAGHLHFAQVLRFSGVNFPQPLYLEITASWQDRFVEARSSALRKAVKSALLSLVRSI